MKTHTSPPFSPCCYANDPVEEGADQPLVIEPGVGDNVRFVNKQGKIIRGIIQDVVKPMATPKYVLCSARKKLRDHESYVVLTSTNYKKMYNWVDVITLVSTSQSRLNSIRKQ